MENCYNCKHARDMFYSINSWDGLYYCEKNEEIYLRNVYGHRCENYEPNLHDHDAARSSPQTRDNGIHQKE